MHNKTPRLIEHQSGEGIEQSAQTSFPGILFKFDTQLEKKKKKRKHKMHETFRLNECSMFQLPNRI